MSMTRNQSGQFCQPGQSSQDAAKAAQRRRMRDLSLSSNRTHGGAACEYSDEWYTPAPLVQALGPFDLDPCAGPNHHAKRNLRRPACGLSLKWKGRVWLNPPFTNVHEWVAKMQNHRSGIMLVNARPDAAWFQCAASSALAIFWIKGRVKFQRPDGSVGNPPVGCVLFAWSEFDVQALRHSGLSGVLTLVDRPSATKTPIPLSSPKIPV